MEYTSVSKVQAFLAQGERRGAQVEGHGYGFSTSEQNHARRRQREVHVTLPYARMAWW